MKQLFAFNTIIQFFLLLGVWLLLSGHYDFTHISMGVFSCILVVLLHLRLRRYYFYEGEISEAKEKLKGTAPVRLRFQRVLFYIPWLIWQIVVASLQVAEAVLNPKMPIDPALLVFKTKLPGTSAKVILGNSITLTPGTISMSVDGNIIKVHALTQEGAAELQAGEMNRRINSLGVRS